MPEPENNRPENQPPQAAGKPYSVRRVNNVPLVIGFCLVAAFESVTFVSFCPMAAIREAHFCPPSS